MSVIEAIQAISQMSDSDKDAVLGAFCRECHQELNDREAIYCMVCEPCCDQKYDYIDENEEM